MGCGVEVASLWALGVTATSLLCFKQPIVNSNERSKYRYKVSEQDLVRPRSGTEEMVRPGGKNKTPPSDGVTVRQTMGLWW